MAYRNGTYVAFNGCSTTDPTKSDIKYFNILKAWKENDDIEFNFVDSHSKTYSVFDTSSIRTLETRLEERLRNSKNFLLIITENSTQNKPILNFEIEKAIEVYKIPIIVAYTMAKGYIDDSSRYYKYLPDKLKEYKNVKKIHIPFEKKPIKCALKQFDMNNFPKYENTIYTKEFYEN